MAPLPYFVLSLTQLLQLGFDVQQLKAREHGSIEKGKVSNQIALSLQYHSGSLAEMREFFLQLWGGDRVSFPTETSLNVILGRVKKEYQKLNKTKGLARTQFLELPFELPAQTMLLADVSNVVREQHDADMRAESLQHRLDEMEMERDQLVLQHEGLQTLLDNLHKQFNDLVSENNRLVQVQLFQESEPRLLKMTENRNKFRRQLKRTNRLLDKEKERSKDKQRQIRALKSKVNHRSTSLRQKVGESIGFSDKLKYARQQITKLEDDIRLRDQIIDTLIEQCQEMGNQVISTKVGNAYSPEIRLLCMKLVGSKVPLANIPDVISTVLSMAGANLSAVPSERTVRRVAGPEVLAMSQAHVAMELTNFSGNLTIQTDETSKYGKQYMATAVRTDEGKTLILGMNEMCNKSAQCTLDILREKLDDVERASGKDGAAKHIVLQMKSSMSDRAATEVRFAELLQSYKESICPAIIANWSDMTEQEKLAFTQVETFFCSLHLLANFAEIMSKCLLEHEATVSVPEQLGSLVDQVGFLSNEPGVFRLIRTAAKCFARRGSEFGLYSQWRLFLEQKNLHLPNFVPFKGNRFNIVFFDAEVTLVSLPYLIDFLENHGKNRLHKSVLADLKEPLFIAELKVLAMIGKAITGPLWRLIESEMHVLDMNEYFSILVHWLEENTIDSASFLAGESLPFDRKLLHNDDVFRRLIEPIAEIDESAVPIASLCLIALSGLLKRMCADQLPGGKYWEPSESLRKETASVPLHNKTPETVFGFLDSLMLRRPNASTLVNEALIMFSKNNTQRWLEAKTGEEAAALVKKAMMDAKELRTIYNDRSRVLKEAAIRKLHDKQEQHQQQLARIAKMREKLTADIISDGLWQTGKDIDKKLATFTGDRQKLLALQRQLQFRKKVLQQPPPKGQSSKFYQFIVNKVPQQVPELRNKLLQLVRDAALSEQVADDLGIVGKYIEHRFNDPETNQERWHKGRVIATVPGYHKWFNIVYDVAPETVFTYKLGDDLANNDLRLL